MTAREVMSEIMRVPDRSGDTCALTKTEADEYFMSLAMEIARGCAEVPGRSNAAFRVCSPHPFAINYPGSGRFLFPSSLPGRSYFGLA